jgi:molybdopterin-guanine dinucleotide biosynthesis protein A
MKQRSSTGIILAGGASRRMGRDKAYLHLGGETALRHAMKPLVRLCSQIIVAGGENPRADALPHHVQWVSDPDGTTGPLAGLVAGLAAANHDVCVVVACDMPFVNERLLEHLVGSLGDRDAVVPVGGGVPQVLHAVYSRRCLATAQSLVRLGARSVQDLLPRIRAVRVSEDRCRTIDHAGLSWFNMNTPDDYRAARALWRASPPARGPRPSATHLLAASDVPN